MNTKLLHLRIAAMALLYLPILSFGQAPVSSLIETSNDASLVLSAVPGAIVAGQSVCSGTNAIFTVITTNSGSGTLSYQWQFSTSVDPSFSNISGANASTYTVNSPLGESDKNQYRCLVSPGSRTAITSTAGLLRVKAVTAATVANQDVCTGTNAVFTVIPTYKVPVTFSYQWQSVTNRGTTGANISAASSACTESSSTSDNNLNKNLVSAVAEQTVCSGSDAPSTVSAAPKGSAGLSYQWQISTKGGSSFSNISGANSSTYIVASPGSTSDNYQYLCLVTSGSGATFTSSAGTLRVNAVASATVNNQNVCGVSNANFTTLTTSTGSAALTYQWKLSTNGSSSFSAISGANSSTYVANGTPAADNYIYECIVTSGSCSSYTSSSGILRVNAIISATVSAQKVCSGTNATFAVSTSNSGPAALSYQWRGNTNGGSTFTDISGATGTSYIVSAPSAASDNYKFEVVVTSGGCSAYTSSNNYRLPWK